MALEYKDNGRAIFVHQDDEHVATIVRQGQKFGYSIFNSPHRDVVNTEDEARSAVERHLS